MQPKRHHTQAHPFSILVSLVHLENCDTYGVHMPNGPFITQYCFGSCDVHFFIDRTAGHFLYVLEGRGAIKPRREIKKRTVLYDLPGRGGKWMTGGHCGMAIRGGVVRSGFKTSQVFSHILVCSKYVCVHS